MNGSHGLWRDFREGIGNVKTLTFGTVGVNGEATALKRLPFRCINVLARVCTVQVHAVSLHLNLPSLFPLDLDSQI